MRQLRVIIQSATTRLLFNWTLLALAALAFWRITFFFVYFPGLHLISWKLALMQFLVGLRYDLATLPLLIGPLYLLAPLITRYQASPGLRGLTTRLLYLLQFPWFAAGNMVIIGSIFNFGVNNKHLGWEFYAYFNNGITFLNGAFDEQPTGTLIYLTMIPVSVWLGWRNVFGQTASPEPEQLRTTPKERLLELSRIVGAQLLLVVLMVVLSRGGLQQNPLRAADALHPDNAFISSLALNGLYTIAQDRNESLDFQKFYERDDNIEHVQRLLGKPDDFPFPDYPLVRYMQPQSSLTGKAKPNIAIIIMESFTAKFLRVNGGNPQIAPNLNRLIERGLYFKRFYSSGGRSANGLICMLAGIPDRSGRTILRSAQIQNRFGGIASLLRQKDYRTFFVHGGDLKFDNLNQALPHLGFEETIGMRKMESDNKYPEPPPWGYHDEHSFDKMLELMDKPGEKPFLGVFFSLNTHHPFAIPDSSYEYFKPSFPQSRFLNAYRYSDEALGEFMKRARRRPFFKNTIFIIVADHAHHAGLNYLEDRTIPLLLYAPGRIRRGVSNEVASQLDLLPTVLGLTGGGYHYAAMGRNLLRPARRPGYAFFAGGSNTSVIGWIEGPHLYSTWLINPIQALYRALPPLDLVNYSKSEPEITAEYQLKTQHFHQFARTLEQENRIWPPAGYFSK